MPQTICARCLAKLTASDRREGRLFCGACEATWAKKPGEPVGNGLKPPETMAAKRRLPEPDHP